MKKYILRFKWKYSFYTGETPELKKVFLLKVCLYNFVVLEENLPIIFPKILQQTYQIVQYDKCTKMFLKVDINIDRSILLTKLTLKK